MTALLDVNVLVALAWPNHVHHQRARRWFADHAAEGWATCPITESGFVRVSANTRVTPHAVSPADGLAALDRFRGHAAHEFFDDDVSVAASPEVARDRIATAAQVTDAHLVALACRREATLVTFDRGVARLAPAGREGSVQLVS